MPEITEAFGALQSPYDVRDYQIAALSNEQIPKEFALPTGAVKNQFVESTCVAFAASQIVEYHNRRQQNTDITFSTEFIYGLREDGYYVGDGMYIRNALNTLRKYGDVPVEELRGNNDYATAMKNVNARIDELKEKAYPNRISTYFRVYSENEMKTALMKHGYLIASMSWHKDAKLTPKDYVYTYNKKDIRGGHAVIIYGWNELGWLVRNSWGASWGNKGDFIVPYDFKFNEVWGVTDNILNNDLKKPSDNALVKQFYKVINWIVNLVTSLFKFK